MPLITIKSSQPIITNKADIASKITALLSRLLNKPSKYIMVIVEEDADIYFDNSEEACCLVDLKSIGGLSSEVNKSISKEICNFIENVLSVNSNRIYINFEDIEAGKWGFDRKTFG